MDPLNQQQPSSAPVTPPMTTPITANSTPLTSGEQKKNITPIILILVVILILVIGALYLFASRLSDQTPTDNYSAGTQNMTTAGEVQPVTNDSDDLTSIESDLNASTQGLDDQNF